MLLYLLNNPNNHYFLWFFGSPTTTMLLRFWSQTAAIVFVVVHPNHRYLCGCSGACNFGGFAHCGGFKQMLWFAFKEIQNVKKNSNIRNAKHILIFIEFRYFRSWEVSFLTVWWISWHLVDCVSSDEASPSRQVGTDVEEFFTAFLKQSNSKGQRHWCFFWANSKKNSRIF